MPLHHWISIGNGPFLIASTPSCPANRAHVKVWTMEREVPLPEQPGAGSHLSRSSLPCSKSGTTQVSHYHRCRKVRGMANNLPGMQLFYCLLQQPCAVEDKEIVKLSCSSEASWSTIDCATQYPQCSHYSVGVRLMKRQRMQTSRRWSKSVTCMCEYGCTWAAGPLGRPLAPQTPLCRSR